MNCGFYPHFFTMKTKATESSAGAKPAFGWHWAGSADADYIEIRNRLGSLIARLPSVNRAEMSKGERAAYESNACQLAAASDMLSQLRLTCQMLERLRERIDQSIAWGKLKAYPGHEADWQNATAALQDARAAIAKAEGRGL
jgi:hypothetical protein